MVRWEREKAEAMAGTDGVILHRVYISRSFRNQGSYGRGLDCVACPANAVCPGGYRMWPAPGYWTHNETTGYVTPCYPASRCLGGRFSSCAEGARMGAWLVLSGDGWKAKKKGGREGGWEVVFDLH